MVPWTRALVETNNEIMALRQQLGLDGAQATPQDDFTEFLEQSNQLSPRALRAAEREYRDSEAQEEEKDYLDFLKTSGQVPVEHPPQEDFNAFLEASNQLTPRALRAAEREFAASEAQEEEKDYLSFLKTSGQVPAEHPPQEDFNAFLEGSNQLTPRALRAAEQEFAASEAQEEDEDFMAFMAETGQIRFPVEVLPSTVSDSASRALQQTIADIAQLKAELGISDTPQDDYNTFLEASNQLTPRALRAAELQYKQGEAQEEEKDYLDFLKTSGQVPAEHPPQEDFNTFLEGSNQLTPRALRAAEQEFAASEAQEEEEDFMAFLAGSGQMKFPAEMGESGRVEDVLTGAEQDILRLRRELGTCAFFAIHLVDP